MQPLGKTRTKLPPSKGDVPVFQIPENALGGNPMQLFQRLNAGPDLKGVINPNYAGALPADWRLSFGRVSPTALLGDADGLAGIVAAFSEFESVSAGLLESERWRQIISHGVQAHQGMLSHYLTYELPFMVRRLDVVVTEQGPLVNENDEMPGRLCPLHEGSIKQRVRRTVEGLLAGLGKKLKGIFR